jgi:hypothetical protein
VLVADSANNTADGRLNVLGVFDRLFVSELPARHPMMTVVIATEIEPTDSNERNVLAIALDDPEGENAAKVSIAVEGPHPQGAHYMNFLLPLPMVQFQREGDYQLSVSVGNSQQVYVIKVEKMESLDASDDY